MSVAIGALMLVCAAMLASGTAAFADDENPTSSASPSPTLANQQQKPSDDGDLQDKIEKKYGGHRDISTPPLLVKQAAQAASATSPSSVPAAKSYVTQPIDVAKGQLNPDAKQDASAAPAPKPFSVTNNQPVIKTLNASSFSNPADEFARTAYLAMGLTAAAAIALFGVAFSRRR